MEGHESNAGWNEGSNSPEADQDLPSIGAQRHSASTEAQAAHGAASASGGHLENVSAKQPACAESDISFDPASFCPEGDSSNTPSPKTTTGGEDWLSLSLYVDHGDFKSLSSTLDVAQQCALLGDQGGDEVVFGDTRFIVKSHGVRRGSRAKGAWMRWVLQSEDRSRLLVGDREEAHKTQPNMTLEVSSDTLMKFGIDVVVGRLRYWLDGMGATLVRNKVSRVDACVDLPNIPVSVFVKPFLAGQFVARARKRSDYFQGMQGSTHYEGEESTGFAIGKSPLMLRVYDKLKECRSKPEKLLLLKKRRWGGLPDCATRVEFEIGRAQLKKHGVDSLEDWLEKRAAICEKLSSKWFRLTEGPVDRKHADRAGTLPDWEAVRGAFAGWCGLVGDVELIPIESEQMDVSRYWKSAVGLIKSGLALAGKNIVDERHFFRELRAGVLDAIGDRDIAEEIRRKRLEQGM